MLFNPSHPGEVLKDYLGDMTVKEAAAEEKCFARAKIFQRILSIG